MTISIAAARQAFAFALATPFTGRLKHRQDRSDFGGEDSYLLKVRRVGRDYPVATTSAMGISACISAVTTAGYVVALQAIFPADIIGYERFATLA